jgi:hypothetical protein
MHTDSVLTDEELIDITGYKLAPFQLQELRRQGFHRARRSPTTRRVIVERQHYDAVCRGDTAQRDEPQLRMVSLRT